MPDFGILKALAKGSSRARVARGAVDVRAANLSAKEATKAEAATLDQQIATEEAKLNRPAQPVQDAVEGQATPVVVKQLEPRPPAVRPLPRTVDAPPLAFERATTRTGVEAEATRLTKLDLGAYDLEEIHQINFDLQTTTDDIKAIIADAAVLNKGRIDVSRRGVIANEQLELLASELNVETDVVRRVMERELGETLGPEHIVGARQVLAESADRVLTLGKKIASGQGTDLDKLRFRRQVMFHDDYQVAFMGARAETGRALNAFNIPVGIELDGDMIRKLSNAVENLNGKDTAELAKMVSQLESVGQVSRFTKQYTRSRVAGVLQELFVSSILSGPKTQVVNTIGNATFQAMNTFEYGVASLVGKIMPGTAHVETGEAAAMLFGQLSGWRDGMRYAKIAFKKGGSLDDAAKYEGHTNRAISSKNMFPDGAPASVAAVLDLIGHVIRAPIERVMIPVDEFFKTTAMRSDLARQAYLEVQNRIMGGTAMSQDEISAFVQKFMETPNAMARQHADEFAKYVTFQNELGVDGQAFQKLLARRGGFVIAPFVKTPVNIFKAGLLERSPLGLFTKNFWRTVAAGGPERDLAIARVGMGSLTVAGTAMLTLDGRITGGGPQDPAARALLLATGWQPYSIRYTDPFSGKVRYQSYSRIEPLAFVIGATADMVEISAFIETDDPLATDQENMNRGIAAVVAGIANNTMSKTFMSGVADFTQAIDDPARYMGDWLTRTSQAFVPYSAFRRQIGQMQDPLIREAWDYTDKLKAGSGWAGYSKELPPRRDAFGQPKRWPVGSLLGAASPFPDSVDKQDPIIDEVVRVMNETQSVPITMPSKKVEGMSLTAQEYDQLLLASRNAPDANGYTFKDSLSELFSSAVYGLATPDYKAILIKQERDRHDDIGRQTLLDNNPAYAARLELYRLKKGQVMYGEM